MISVSLRTAHYKSMGNVILRYDFLGRPQQRRPRGNSRKTLPGETTFGESYSRGQSNFASKLKRDTKVNVEVNLERPLFFNFLSRPFPLAFLFTPTSDQQ